MKGYSVAAAVVLIITLNTAGKSTSQSKIEVWADKEGRYYVKGLEGAQKDLVIVNDGERKWQVQLDEKEVDLLTAFPDTHSFTFELGKEIEAVKNTAETKVVGDDIVAGRATTIEGLTSFIKGLNNGIVELSPVSEQSSGKPQVEVPVDLKVEEGDQKNVDAGHSPWKLDSAFVAQVFVSLKISPEGIQGEYPIKYEELKIVQNTGKEAVIEISGSKTPIKRVYLKRLIRQDDTGIWTVVGYDPIN